VHADAAPTGRDGVAGARDSGHANRDDGDDGSNDDEDDDKHLESVRPVSAASSSSVPDHTHSNTPGRLHFNSSRALRAALEADVSTLLQRAGVVKWTESVKDSQRNSGGDLPAPAAALKPSGPLPPVSERRGLFILHPIRSVFLDHTAVSGTAGCSSSLLRVIGRNSEYCRKYCTKPVRLMLPSEPTGGAAGTGTASQASATSAAAAAAAAAGFTLVPRALPSLSTWIRAASAISSQVFTHSSSASTATSLPSTGDESATSASVLRAPDPAMPIGEALHTLLRDCLDPTMRFSHVRCAQAFSLARRVYSRDRAAESADDVKLRTTVLSQYRDLAAGPASAWFEHRLITSITSSPVLPSASSSSAAAAASPSGASTGPTGRKGGAAGAR